MSTFAICTCNPLCEQGQCCKGPHTIFDVVSLVCSAYLDGIDKNALIKTDEDNQHGRVKDEKFAHAHSYISMVMLSLLFKVSAKQTTWSSLFDEAGKGFEGLDCFERVTPNHLEQMFCGEALDPQFTELAVRAKHLPSLYKQRALLNLQECYALYQQILDNVRLWRISLKCHDLAKLVEGFLCYLVYVETALDAWTTEGAVYNQYARLWFNLKALKDIVASVAYDVETKACTESGVSLWVWLVMIRAQNFKTGRQDIAWTEGQDYDIHGAWLPEARTLHAGFQWGDFHFAYNPIAVDPWVKEPTGNDNAVAIITNTQALCDAIDNASQQDARDTINAWLNAVFFSAQDKIKALLPSLMNQCIVLQGLACDQKLIKIRYLLISTALVAHIATIQHLSRHTTLLFKNIADEIQASNESLMVWISQYFISCLDCYKEIENFTHVVCRLIALTVEDMMGCVRHEQQTLQKQVIGLASTNAPPRRYHPVSAPPPPAQPNLNFLDLLTSCWEGDLEKS